MTDEEIEKALSCCKDDSYDICIECPIEEKYQANFSCRSILVERALKYIKRLKAEIASLTGAVDALKTDNENLTRTLKECDEELEERVIEADENAALAMEQKLRADKLEEEIKTVRKETAKEILDELDKYLWDDIDCTSDFTGREHNATVKQLINIIKKKYSVEVEE